MKHLKETSGAAMKKIKLCFIGCGAVTRMHSRMIRARGLPVELFYASRTLANAQEYCRKFGGLNAFGDYEAACAAAEVEAVFICTPHALHLEHARLAARYRKPVLIEKPATRTLAELDQLEATVREAGVLCMVAENYFFKPIVAVLRKHLDAGDIGEPLFFELNRINRGRNHGWRANEDMMGGGALLEGGVHWINLMRCLGGEVQSVLALRPEKKYAMVSPSEDGLEALFKFQNGAVGKLLHSWNLANRLRGLSLSKIYGTEGNIHFESNGLFALILGRKKRLRVSGLLDLMGYGAMLRRFLQCVREQSEPEMSLAVARRDLALVEAAYRSLASGRLEAPD